VTLPVGSGAGFRASGRSLENHRAMRGTVSAAMIGSVP